MKIDGKYFFTSLALLVGIIGLTDLVFALDSIPTIVSLIQEGTQGTFSADDLLVIYSSNIFAVMGLRSLFTIVETLQSRFYLLKYGISFILVFIGIKMLIEFFHIIIPINISLIIILIGIVVPIILSNLNKKNKR